jgi:hypothetical protein
MHRAPSVACDGVGDTESVLNNGDATRVQDCVTILDGQILSQNSFECARLACDARAASRSLGSDERQLADGGEEVRRV